MFENQRIVREKLRDFAKKYYLNQLYKGAIFFVAITLLTFILYTVLEYFSYFNSVVRSILFYSYILLFALTFIFYILIPILKILGLGKQISNEKIASLIGKHFPEIDDKLLNILQLENLMKEGKFKSYDLLIAAIDAKSEKIKPFPFVKAIPFKKSTRYLKWVSIPILLFILLFSVKSEIFTDSTKRIVQYQQYFERPAPYNFEILNPSLTAFQNETYELRVKVVGDEVPQEVYIAIKDKRFKLQAKSLTEFSYTFQNIQRTTEFQLVTEEFTSKPYIISVLPKPVTISFVVNLQYPAYLNKNNETVENNGDILVPEGTTLTWSFYTKNTDSMLFITDNLQKTLQSDNDIYQISVRAKNSFDYAVINANKYYSNKDTLKHAITVVPDKYPEIFVESRQDSFFADRIYFKGNVKDDYGFNSLKFVYSKFNADGDLLETNQAISIDIQNRITLQDFYYYFDAGILYLEPGYRLEYHFEVRDNDAPNGFKMSKTSTFNYRFKTLEEIEQELKQGNSEMKDDFSQLLKQSKQLSKELEQLRQQIMQSKTTSWQDQQKMSDLIEKYNDLQKQIQDLKNQQNEQYQVEEQYKNLTPEILKKQEELQKRFDEILSDELKEMFQKMQDMMNELNKDKMMEMMEKMKLSNEEINKSLDEQLQLFKYLEFEKKYDEIIDKMRQLAQEEKQLAEETKNKQISKEELLQKQENVEQKYEQLNKEIQELKKLNKELEEPTNMKDHSELQKDIEKDMQESKESLQKNNRNKASEKQKTAGEKLEELSYQMELDKLENEGEELEEDIETLRQILDNLVRISFQQEENLVAVRAMSPRSSSLTDAVRKQFTIQENMVIIRDSLNALARRQAAVKPFIHKEVSKIETHLEQAKVNLNDRRTSNSASNQQFALTSINNLALMLGESLKEIKQKQQQNQSQCSKCKKKGKSSSSCSNSGNSKKSKAKTARELQQQLNRQMEALKRSLEQGDGKQNNMQQPGQPSLSEQFAKMAAQQEAIRKMMQDLQDELKAQNGVGDKSLEQMIQEMQRTEKELVNKTITQQTINRQKNIETRLLESERAEMKQEKEEKRESQVGRDMRNPNPPKDWDIDKTKQKQTEMLKTVPPNLNYYYKEKVNQYFYNIE
ncbi:MAG TPA: hypothetical protein P5134_02155 [Bacteroidales bacterium]|nr:hypothetical protein [Bacteroidales bacterium]HRT13397.1 hypothetical protein [Bacteroidales bacterium]